VDAVLSGDPANPEALFVKGKIDVAEGRLEDAVAALRRAVDGRPDWAQAHFLLGSALFLQRDLNGARASVARSLELDADLLESQRVLARIHAALGEDELAVEVGRRVQERGSGDPKLQILIAQSLVRLSRLEDAAAELESIPPDSRDAEAHFAMGRIAYLQGDRAEARTSFLAAAELEPYRFEILRSLLDLDLRENRLQDSAARVRAAANALPENARLQQLLGLVALYAGDSPSAEASFRRAIELDPNDLGGYENLARYLLVTGRPAEVLRTYRAALERNPSSGTLHLIVGSLLELQGKTAEAIAEYEQAVRLNPDLAVAKNNLAYLITESGGNLDRALDLAQEAKEMLPDNPNASDTLGWVLFKKNVPSAAIGYLKEAESGLRPEDPQMGTVRQHLALAYEADGQPEQARQVLERALRDLDSLSGAGGGEEQPEPPWAKDVRAMLERLGRAAPAAPAAQEG
jgi:tetratricopeptide (TPR) repeat protein